MSEKKKDDRLEELMKEFLGDSNAKEGTAKNTAQPHLDNSNMITISLFIRNNPRMIKTCNNRI